MFKKYSHIVYFFNIIFVLVISGCDIEPGQAPGDFTQTDWHVIWSNEEFYNPTQAEGSIKETGWKGVFESQSGIKFSTEKILSSKMPNAGDLDYDNLASTLSRLVDDFYENCEQTGEATPPDKVSILFGVNDIPNSDNDLGVTLPRGGVSKGVAVSLVLVGKIASLHSQSKALYTDETVLHELGHARGLNVPNMSGGEEPLDHTYHFDITDNGSTIQNSTCIMISPTAPTKPFNFCDYHKSILSKCLKSSILNNYSPSDNCAIFP